MNRPVTLVCFICGREFGTKSLAIHVKACQKKWENAENLKPPKQRRPCPRQPKGFQDLTSKEKITKDDINKFNAKSYDAFVEQGLVQCEYCGRRFNQKSLVPHQKACKTNPMIRKPYVNKGPLGKITQQQQPISKNTSSYKMNFGDQQSSNTGNLVPCRRCGRKFNADRVGKHQKVCKADKVEIHKAKKEEEVPQYKAVNKMKPNFGIQKKAKWKIQSEQLQNAMKMMRKIRAVQAKGGKLSDLPPPPPSNYDHYVQCKYCGRKYAADVAERHIPKCANIINKPGGIKPSRIQQKYISGTGANSNNSYVNKTPSNKPNLVTSNKMTGNMVSNSGLGSNYPNSSANYGNISKPSTSSNLYGNSKVGPTNSNTGTIKSNIKPNLMGKSNANNYW